jgi:hypothetical protein
MGLNSILGLLQSFGLGWVIEGLAPSMHGQIKDRGFNKMQIFASG